GEQAAAERAVTDHPDTEFPQQRQQFRLRVAAEQRILVLASGYGVYRVCPPDRRRRRLGDAEKAHLPRADQFAQRAPGLLDRHIRVDPVLVIEVDVVDAQALQRVVARTAHVAGPAVDAAGPVRPELLAELGGEQHLG